MANCIVWLASQAGRLDELAQLPADMFDDKTLKRALYVAAANDHAEIVRFLLRVGVTNKYAMRLQQPLRSAARYNSADAMRALVEAKADVYCDTIQGNRLVWPQQWHTQTRCAHCLLLLHIYSVDYLYAPPAVLTVS